MGLLQKGRWVEQWYDKKSNDGELTLTLCENKNGDLFDLKIFVVAY